MSVLEKARAVRQAYLELSVLNLEKRNQALKELSRLLQEESAKLIDASLMDYKLAHEALSQGEPISKSFVERLKLDNSKIESLVHGIEQIVSMPDPVGRKTLHRELDKDLILTRKTVPLGVVGVIFESRPDVMPQIYSLLLKTANGGLLKGGAEASYSHSAFLSLVKKLEGRCPWLPRSTVEIINSREDVKDMLKLDQDIDLVIPRGGNQLVQYVMQNTKIPVLGHADGVCHIYVHSSANLDRALTIINDSKVQYPSACNAVETLLIDTQVAQGFLPRLGGWAQLKNVEIFACEKTRAIIPEARDANDKSWHREYGDLQVSVKIVSGLSEAIEHINFYGSHHTEAIVAEEELAISEFQSRLDSANVFANCSTRFSDGFRYGFGAEVGISTSKTHARGPVGVDGLLSYKYLLSGKGQTVAEYTGENPRVFLHRDID